MLLSDLQNKDIISTDTGENIGRIIDVEIDSSGKILYIYVEGKKFFRKYFNNEEIKFTYESIEKIGADVILVKL
ncbi:MAG: YlmC/YmxH family sporulation protein [Bacilli bacterium]|nr:YlmC/YmxH family sporulation protein [Bacilli bacterium]